MVPEGGRPRLPAVASEGVGGGPFRVGRIADIEDRELQAEHAAGGWIDVAADAQEVGGIERVQVGRESRHLQLADDPRLRRIGQIDDKQRIDLPERAHVAPVTDEADRVDPFARGEPGDAADGLQVAGGRGKHVDTAGRCVAESAGRRHPQQAVVALVERELVERDAGYGAHRRQLHVGILQVELVDVRGRAGVGGVPPVAPMGGGDVEVRGGGVDAA